MDDPRTPKLSFLELKYIIARPKESGLSIFLVGQNIAMALALADYAYILSRAEILYESPPKELRNMRN
jgi:ABC-type branched-subunit amino acid transport system ATPase component